MQVITILTGNDLVRSDKEKPIREIEYGDFDSDSYLQILKSDKAFFFDKDKIRCIKNRQGFLGQTEDIKNISANDLLILFT